MFTMPNMKKVHAIGVSIVPFIAKCITGKMKNRIMPKTWNKSFLGHSKRNARIVRINPALKISIMVTVSYRNVSEIANFLSPIPHK